MRIPVSLLILFYVFSAQAADKALDSVMTTDADAIFMVRDISELRNAWEKHPLILDFDDASLYEFIEPLFVQPEGVESRSAFDEVMEEFGLDTDELFELFPGQLGMGLYNLSEMLLQKSERPDLAIMADFSGSAERLDELMRIQFERNAEAQKELNPEIEHEMIEERFMGETLYFDEVFDGEETYIEDGYAFVDGTFVLATPAERLRTMVESIKAGTEHPIARSAVYQRVREESGPADAMVYVNFESFVPELNKALLEQTMAGGLAMFGVTGQSLNAALALDALQAFSFDFKIQEDAITSNSAIVYREKAGLLQLLTYGEGALPSANFVPEGALSSMVGLFDLSEMFVRLEALLGVASPTTPALINIQLQQVKTNTGVDLRSALLNNFGTEMVSFSVLPETAGPVANAFVMAEQVYVLEIKDKAALSNALETLKDMVPGARAQIESRDFQGETIYTIRGVTAPSAPDAPNYGFSYVLTRGYLIFGLGRSGLVQSVLTAMQSTGTGFWQLEETRAMIDRIGKPGAVSRSYTDFGQAIIAMLESISDARELTGGGIPPDGLKLPTSLELPWHMLTETYEADDGMFSHMILLRKEEL